MLRDDVRRRSRHRPVDRGGDQSRERGALVRRLAGTAEDERRHADRVEDLPDVGFVEHPEGGHCVARAGRRTHVREVPVRHRLDRRDPERKPKGVGRRAVWRSPTRVDRLQLLLELVRTDAPRVVGSPGDPGSCVAEHQRDRPRRMRSREQAAERTAVGERDDRRPLAAGVVEHGAEVVDALLHRREPIAAQPIGQPRAPVVEADDTAVAGETVDERRHHREPTEDLELGDVRPDQHHVCSSTRPDHLVGQMDVAVSRVPDAVVEHAPD